MLQGKKIILGITGSIAAYKTATLTRLLVKSGAEVKVVMTPDAHHFITPLTLATLSKNPVTTEFTKNDQGEWNNHVALGLWADAIVIAPASANTIAKMATGLCDNLLLGVYLSARCPVFFAPAMDLDMLQHPTSQGNLAVLKKNGNHCIEPSFGELASGLIGNGRMAELENIHQYLHQFFQQHQPLAGKTALVTAGPTYEAIDPVRFIGNHSSGKMGFALAEALAQQGAIVNLITGPTALHIEHQQINVIRVTSADEMYNACHQHFESSTIAVLSAAVADYKPLKKEDQKIKKKDSTLTMELTKTPDIAASLGKIKRSDQLIVGFALETEKAIENAIQKLENKNFDFIVLNSLQDEGAGFGHDTNKISIIDKNHQLTSLALKSKKEVAKDIVDTIIAKLHA